MYSGILMGHFTWPIKKTKNINMQKIALFSLIIVIAVTGCRGVFGKRVRGNGNITTETRNITGFGSVDVSGAIDVYVKTDSVQSVKVEADDNLQQYIEVYNDRGTLRIHTRNGYNIRSSRGVNVYVSGPAFRRLEASGACDIYSENKIMSAEKMEIDLSGASDARVELNAPEVSVDVSGAGSVSLKGETKDLTLDGSGSSNFKCYDLMAENVNVEISGAGDAQVSASVKLDVNVSGAGSVRYKGNPQVNQRVSGSGSVKKSDTH